MHQSSKAYLPTWMWKGFLCETLHLLVTASVAELPTELCSTGTKYSLVYHCLVVNVQQQHRKRMLVATTETSLDLVCFSNTGSSPHTFMELSPGSHRVKIVPNCRGRNRRAVSASFVV